MCIRDSYEIYNNLMLRGGLKLREGFGRKAYNNITYNNGLSPHVWYHGSKDQVYSNLFMAPHKPARMPANATKKGTTVDRNFYSIANPKSAQAKSKKLGWDANSVYGTAEFVDPKNLDFTVKAGSPVFETGFKNFPMDQFGVKKPELKKIARVPSMDKPAKPKGAPTPAVKKPKGSVVLNVLMRDLADDEFSAFGVSQEDGGAVVIKGMRNSPFVSSAVSYTHLTLPTIA